MGPKYRRARCTLRSPRDDGYQPAASAGIRRRDRRTRGASRDAPRAGRDWSALDLEAVGDRPRRLAGAVARDGAQLVAAERQFLCAHAPCEAQAVLPGAVCVAEGPQRDQPPAAPLLGLLAL